jgi:hypothetical protein
MKLDSVVEQVNKAKIGQQICFQLGQGIDGKRSASLLLTLVEFGKLLCSEPTTKVDLELARAFSVDHIRTFVLIKAQHPVDVPPGIEKGITSVSIKHHDPATLTLEYKGIWQLVLEGNLYLAKMLLDHGYGQMAISPKQKKCVIEIRGDQEEVLEHALMVAEKLGLELTLPD